MAGVLLTLVPPLYWAYEKRVNGRTHTIKEVYLEMLSIPASQLPASKKDTLLKASRPNTVSNTQRIKWLPINSIDRLC